MKKGSSGSLDGFIGMKTDDKLIYIVEQLHRSYDKIRELETEQTSYREEVKIVSEGFSKLSHRVVKMEQLCETQWWTTEVLSYKSIDAEARSMRTNIMIYCLTENFRYNTTTLVLNFLESELGIGTSEICIERAHRLGQVNDTKNRVRQDPKLPVVVRFRDYVDTETILRKAYTLTGTYSVFHQPDEDVVFFNDRYLNGELDIMFSELNVPFCVDEIVKACKKLNSG